MSERKKRALDAKVLWEGGICEALVSYGLTGQDFEEAGYSSTVGGAVEKFLTAHEEMVAALEAEGFDPDSGEDSDD